MEGRTSLIYCSPTFYNYARRFNCGYERMEKLSKLELHFDLINQEGDIINIMESAKGRIH
jgi:hypothetical protein